MRSGNCKKSHQRSTQQAAYKMAAVSASLFATAASGAVKNHWLHRERERSLSLHTFHAPPVAEPTYELTPTSVA